MNRKVVITEYRSHILAALIEDGKTVELHFSCPIPDKNAEYTCSGQPQSAQRCRVGEIYVGKVRNILPNIHGAFIEIGDDVQCYYSLEEKTPPIFTHKLGKKPLCVGDELLVQVQKEAVKTKQPVVTGNLNFTGKYVVLTSGNLKTGVSSKLSKEKREALLALGERYRESPFGLIFRTNSGAAPQEAIIFEIEKLAEKLNQVKKYGSMRTCYSRIYKVPSAWTSVLRDVYHEGLTEIIVDATLEDGAVYQEAEEFLRNEQPEDLPLLRNYTDTSYSLVKCYGLEASIQEALKEKVWMKSGAYLVIQPTEALTVIDVNSGKCMKKQNDFTDINQEAAREAAHQIRLRNLSGIIIIDFINMKTEEEKKRLLGYLQNELNQDPNPGKVMGMTHLQLVEITRKKIHKTLEESLR